MWQSIKTAPKDGTPVLVFSPHVPLNNPTNVVVAKFENYRGVWSYCENVLADISGPIEPEPTHWMPLPKPPRDWQFP